MFDYQRIIQLGVSENWDILKIFKNGIFFSATFLSKTTGFRDILCSDKPTWVYNSKHGDNGFIMMGL